MHFAFQASGMLEPKAYSHLQSAFEQGTMWNLTCFFIPSYTWHWHFICSLSPAPNWPVQYYLQFWWRGIKVNSLVLFAGAESSLAELQPARQSLFNENFQLPHLRDRQWVKYLPPSPPLQMHNKNQPESCSTLGKGYIGSKEIQWPPCKLALLAEWLCLCMQQHCRLHRASWTAAEVMTWPWSCCCCYVMASHMRTVKPSSLAQAISSS